VQALKGNVISGSSPLRKILVVFQFSLSIILIICTIVVSKQSNYINSKDLGFDKDHVVYIPLNQNLSEKYESVKNELLQHTDILNAAATSSKIGIRQRSSFDITSWDGNDGDQRILLNRIDAGNDFLETFNMEMVSGRYFSEDFAADSAGVVLNETAIRAMRLTDPIGKKIADRFTITGVIKDFNFRSLHSGIEPLALFRNPGGYSYLAVKIKAGNIPGTIQYLEEVTKKFAPDFPFEYHFLDEDFEKMYRSEIRMGELFFYFAMLAILISCLGLFALAAFAAEQRTKEIGIRKVVGASVSGLFILLSKEFSKWVLFANIFAWPIAYYFMDKWLQNFAYRINIGIWTFLLAGALALVIALVTVSYQTIRSAFANPVESLRYE
jgi:putative ABC transport system permease protein